jgi:dihydrofolate reductase
MSRKIIVLSFMSLDGVIQAPGGPEEDTSGGFKHGGWVFPYADDFFGAAMAEQMGHPFDLLLGRTTYDIFAAYWPHHGAEWPGINEATKYVASHRPLESDWEKSVLLKGDVVEETRKLKAQDGPDLQVYGSANLIQRPEALIRRRTVAKDLSSRWVLSACFRWHVRRHSGRLRLAEWVMFANYERAGEGGMGR